jgi:hypothetical protein
MFVATAVHPTVDGGSLRWCLLLPLSGTVFVVLAVVGIVGLGGDTPSSGASAAKVLSFYDAHSTRQGIGAFILAASVPFLVAFGASLTTALWPAESGRLSVWELQRSPGA